MTTEPSALVGTITGLVAAIVTLLVAFGVPLSDDQRQAILGLVAVAAPIIAGLIIRGTVWSPASAQREIDRAAQTGTARRIL